MSPWFTVSLWGAWFWKGFLLWRREEREGFHPVLEWLFWSGRTWWHTSAHSPEVAIFCAGNILAGSWCFMVAKTSTIKSYFSQRFSPVGTSHLPRDVSLAEPSKVPAGYPIRDCHSFSSPTPSHSPTALQCVSLSTCVCLRTSKGYRACFVGFRWTLSGPTLRPQRVTSMCFTRVLLICSVTERLSPGAAPWWEGAKFFCRGTAKAKSPSQQLSMPCSYSTGFVW